MKFTEYIGSQFSNPRGIIGVICSLIMNVMNKKLYHGIVNSLDLKKDNQVLEIGYGNGRLTKLLSNQYDCIVYGIDISEDMKEVANKRNKKGVSI